MGKRSARTQDEDDSDVRKRRKLENTELVSADIGIIESVSLCNFMCHENLNFEFGPHINFIIGKNGSGKSAILTGIILALGGRSSVTGRYPNIKGFIREGKQKAKIEVVLKNCGDLPYKPDLYGTKVVVVREINSDGVSSYKLKSAAGKVISTHKEELNNILNAMDIQIENPVSLLTQENSRSFLMSKKPDKLYQFYYHGSGLEALEKSYNSVQMMYEDAVNALQKKKEMLPGMEAELKSLKKIISTTDKVHHYKHELLWAIVIEMENKLKGKMEELQKVSQEQEAFKQKLDSCKNQLAEKTSVLAELHKKRQTCCSVTLPDLRQKIKELNEKRDSLSSGLRVHEGKFNAAKRKEKATQEEMLSLQNSISENSRSSRNEDEEKRQREIQIQNLIDERARHENSLKKLELERVQKMELRNQLDTELENKDADISNCLSSLRQNERFLGDAQNALKNKFCVFGNETQNVLNEIKKRSHEFSQLPKGPIGMYIEVKDPKWCNAVEECISTGMLKGFCCDNWQDSLALKKILDKFYPPNQPFRPSVITSKYVTRVHDVSRNRPQTPFCTVLDMLKISDPVIANVLIDSAYVESKVLIEDTKTAIDVMIGNPQNCFGAILLDCSTIELRPYRYYSNAKRSRESLLSSIGESRIKSLKDLVVNSNLTLQALKSERMSVSKRVDEIPNQLSILDRDIVACRRHLKKVSETIQDLQNFQDPRGMHCMEEDLEQLETDLEKIQVEVQKYESSIKEAKEELRGVFNEINTHKTLLEKEDQLFRQLSSELNTISQEEEQLGSVVNKISTKLQEATNRLEPLKKEVEDSQTHVETAFRSAEEVGPRIDTDRSSADLGRLLQETVKVVEQQSDCNREELRKKYVEKFESLKQAKKKLVEKEKQIEQISIMFSQRKEHFQTTCTLTEVIINMAYTSHLNKYYSGELVFNSQTRTLTLKAMPIKSGSELKRKGGKCSSLSGGERSFVTIAFLLAMWERIASPFKILDEYDVFMDSNNRNLSIGLLIEQAKNFPKSQFIFLSPLDLPEIKPSPYIAVHQMNEPRRGENS